MMIMLPQPQAHPRPSPPAADRGLPPGRGLQIAGETRIGVEEGTLSPARGGREGENESGNNAGEG